jgi:hypothetical protein
MTGRYLASLQNHSRQTSQRRAIVLVNAGADFHIGANRMYVELARDWARHGFRRAAIRSGWDWRQRHAP